MRRSRLPEGGANLFQEIKRVSAEAEASGIKLIKLSIGQPQGPALLTARWLASAAIMSNEESMHEYQDNGSPGVPDFAQRFVAAQGIAPGALRDADVAYLPIPGIKPMLRMVMEACREDLPRLRSGKLARVSLMTKPGYPTPRDQAGYLGLDYREIWLTTENEFRVEPNFLDPYTKLVMLNYPHNPTGQVINHALWERVCQWCVEHDARLFNDAAYAPLVHTENACTLTEVAVEFPDLSWAEAFSASKIIGNGTGWRVGAMVGSPDFIADISTIKGNTDSGFTAPQAVGVLAAVESDQNGIEANRQRYEQRLDLLINILEGAGMQMAVRPQAGFFTLWKCPQRAFGRGIVDARQFNYLMIKETGVVGVHFDPYIRYAVTLDILPLLDQIGEAFRKAQVEYDT